MLKTIISSTLMTMAALTSEAQTVNDIPIKDLDVEYVQIVGTSKPFSTKLTIKIDFGQPTKFFFSGRETIIKDGDGKEMNFNSIIDALNFMAKNDFEFVNAYAVTGTNENVYHYLLRNRKNKAKE